MSVKIATSPELKNAVLTALLRTKDECGEVTAADVRDASKVVGCSERTIWRWLQRGSVPSGERKRWTPKAEHRELLLRHGGSIADLRETLAKAGEETVCVRTMQRAFAREFATAYLTFARQGYQKAQAHMPTTAMPDLAINEEWSMDDTQLPVWCILPGGEVGKAQLQGVIDGCSRYVLSHNISPYVFNTEDAIENLASAMAGHHTNNGVFVGGKPRALRTDRGSIFVSQATSMGLITESVARRFSEAYTPQQNGKIERWHRFKKAFKKLPGYDWTDFRAGDPRKASVPPPAENLLTFEELVVEVARTVREYNTERLHRAHGMTPEECWEREVAADPTLVRPADGVSLRAAMRQSMTRNLRRRRVQWDGRFYNLHPQSVQDPDEPGDVIDQRRRQIDAAEGTEVTVRFLHGRIEYVSVYNSRGSYLGDGVWDQIQTVEQAGETAQARRRHIKTMSADLESIAFADAEAVAARRAEALASVDSGDAYYSQFDEDDDTTQNSSVLAGSDPVAARKSKTAKKVGPARQSGRKRGANATPSRRELAEERRRQDLAEASTWTRSRDSA